MISTEHTSVAASNTVGARSTVLNQIPMLRIIGGRLCGTEMRINRDTRLTIGSELSNDVVLRDASVANRQISIIVTADGIELEVLEGDVLAGEEIIPAGETCRIENRTLRLGDVELEIQAGNTDVTGDTLIPVADTLVKTDYKADYDALKSPHEETSTLPFLGSVAAIGLVIGVLLVWQFTGVTADSDQPLSVEALLESSPFAALEVDRSNGQTIVSGLVDTREDAIALASLLRQSSENVVNKTQTGAVLAARVVDVFRVNGVKAEAIATGLSEVTATTSIADAERLKQLREIVRVDLPQLEKLLIDNTPPPVEAQEMTRQAARVIVDPGKRVSLVVSEAPAYVVTEDLSRYFIGSLLPTGHRIAAIDAGRVSLEKGGVITELEF